MAIGLNFLRLRVPKSNSYTGNCLWNEGTWPQGRDSPGIPGFLGRNVSALSNHRDLEDSGAIMGTCSPFIDHRTSLFGRGFAKCFARENRSNDRFIINNFSSKFFGTNPLSSTLVQESKIEENHFLKTTRQKGENLVESDLIWIVACIAGRSEGIHVDTLSARGTHPVRTIDS